MGLFVMSNNPKYDFYNVWEVGVHLEANSLIYFLICAEEVESVSATHWEA